MPGGNIRWPCTTHQLATRNSQRSGSPFINDTRWLVCLLHTQHGAFPVSVVALRCRPVHSHTHVYRVVSCRVALCDRQDMNRQQARQGLHAGIEKVELTGRLRASMLPLTAGGRPQGCGLEAIASTFAAICYHLLATRPLPGRPNCVCTRRAALISVPPVWKGKYHGGYCCSSTPSDGHCVANGSMGAMTGVALLVRFPVRRRGASGHAHTLQGQKNQARDASPGPPEPRAKPHLSLPVPRVRARASWRRPSPWKGSRYSSRFQRRLLHLVLLLLLLPPPPTRDQVSLPD